MADMQETFTIVFDGEALRDHTMDVRDLAPALLSLNDLLDAANAELYGESLKVDVRIRAVQEGSFEVTLTTVATVLRQLMEWAGGSKGQQLESLLGIVGMVASGATATGVTLFGLLKWLRNNKVKEIQKPHGSGEVRLVYDEVLPDGTSRTISLDVPAEVWNLARNRPVREAVARFIKPLEREGIDTLRIKHHDQPIFEATKNDLPSLGLPPSATDDLISDDEYVKAFTIVSLSFKGDNKWRLNDGNATINVAIEDQEFLDKVAHNDLGFHKDDVLRCRVAVTQRMTKDGLKTEYTVKRVLEHRPAARQINLTLSTTDEKH